MLLLAPPLDRVTIGRKIKALRNAASLTMEDVGDDTGVNKSTISRLEAGEKVNFPIDFPFRLAAALGCDVSDIWADCEPEGDD